MDQVGLAVRRPTWDVRRFCLDREPTTLIIKFTFVAAAPTFTLDGENEHCAPVGNPEQAKVTFETFAVPFSES